jgi:hypothetical protein
MLARVGGLIERLAQQSKLRIAFWLSAALFWVLFIVQTGARGAAGLGVLVLLFAVAYRSGRNARAQRPPPEEPPWLRPLLIPLAAVLALVLIGGLLSDQGALDRVIDGVLVVQLILSGLILVKGQKPLTPDGPRSTTEDQ